MTGRILVKTIFQILLSSLVLILGYECMVESFHLLNEPSDSAVFAGMAILLLLSVLTPAVLWRFWRR
jgi:hypothetical protein